MALIWNEQNREQCEMAGGLRRYLENNAGWSTAMSAGGMLVVLQRSISHDFDRVYGLTRNQGVVLGRVFKNGSGDRCSSMPITTFRDVESAKIVNTKGGELLGGYWGEYVAFLHNAETHEKTVLRDPSGAVPCQHSTVNGVNVYFVRLRDLELIRHDGYSPNTHYILGYLAYDSACVPETGLNEVGTVLSGERIAHSGSSVARDFAWNPLRFATTNVIDSADVAEEFMRSTVSDCIGTLASCFNCVSVNLSGGLDSAIVLAAIALASRRPQVLCINEFSKGSDSDERFYARQMAERVGCRLIERERNPDISFDHLRTLPRSVAPYPNLYSPEVSRRKVEFLQSLGAEALFSGIGGDEVFFRGGVLPTAVDHAYRHGVTRSLFRTALEDAALDGLSIWGVLKLAARFGLFRAPWGIRSIRDARFHSLMSVEARDAAAEDVTHWHPLYREPISLPPLKTYQAYIFTFMTAFAHIPSAIDGGLIGIHPLRSQPVLELSLRIPTYVLREGGRDRAIARRAFGADLPDDIVRRRSKGGEEEYLSTIMEKNRAIVRDLLLDGFLVRERLVDRSKLEQVLSGQLTALQSTTSELLDYLSIEGWASSFSWYNSRVLRVA